MYSEPQKNRLYRRRSSYAAIGEWKAVGPKTGGGVFKGWPNVLCEIIQYIYIYRYGVFFLLRFWLLAAKCLILYSGHVSGHMTILWTRHHYSLLRWQCIKVRLGGIFFFSLSVTSVHVSNGPLIINNKRKQRNRIGKMYKLYEWVSQHKLLLIKSIYQIYLERLCIWL